MPRSGKDEKPAAPGFVTADAPGFVPADHNRHAQAAEVTHPWEGKVRIGDETMSIARVRPEHFPGHPEAEAAKKKAADAAAKNPDPEPENEKKRYMPEDGEPPAPAAGPEMEPEKFSRPPL